MPETIASRPLPQRPSNGLLAWQSTIGYISAQYSLDATLTIQAHAEDKKTVLWDAAVTWKQVAEKVTGKPSLIAALRDLWREVDRNHVIFESREAMLRRPTNYADDEWLDKDTETILHRVVQVTQAVYRKDWAIILIYRPVETTQTRCMVRLLARQNTVQTAGQGPTLREACHDLYRNAAPYFVAHSGKQLEDIA